MKALRRALLSTSQEASQLEELKGKKLGALKTQARSLGVDEAEVTALVDDAVDPKQAIVELIIKRTQTSETAKKDTDYPAAESGYLKKAQQELENLKRGLVELHQEYEEYSRDQIRELYEFKDDMGKILGDFKRNIFQVDARDRAKFIERLKQALKDRDEDETYRGGNPRKKRSKARRKVRSKAKSRLRSRSQ